MIRNLLFTAVCSLVMCACTSTTESLYSWHKYEESTYNYSKSNTEESKIKMLDQYKKITENQSGVRKVVQPGLYAEYGFLLYKAGKKDMGLSFLNEEIKLYPESEKYISRIIKQLTK